MNGMNPIMTMLLNGIGGGLNGNNNPLLNMLLNNMGMNGNMGNNPNMANNPNMGNNMANGNPMLNMLLNNMQGNGMGNGQNMNQGNMNQGNMNQGNMNPQNLQGMISMLNNMGVDTSNLNNLTNEDFNNLMASLGGMQGSGPQNAGERSSRRRRHSRKR